MSYVNMIRDAGARALLDTRTGVVKIRPASRLTHNQLESLQFHYDDLIREMKDGQGLPPPPSPQTQQDSAGAEIVEFISYAKGLRFNRGIPKRTGKTNHATIDTK